MGQQIDLLRGLPRTSRNIESRKTAKTQQHIDISRQYGFEYFDGSREYGYGGYKYDGRWLPVAKDIVEHFSLGKKSRVLDVGCAKGFLVKDLEIVCPGLRAFGIDVSEYAVLNCEPEVVGQITVGNALKLDYPDNSFDAVLSINTIHNLDRNGCVQALREIQRVSKGGAFVQVDSYHNDEQRVIFESWVLTAKFHDYPDEWINLFNEAGYTGDYNWTIV